MHVLSAIYQYVSVNIWSEGGFHQRRSPSSTYFCPVPDLSLVISSRNHYQNGSMHSKYKSLLSLKLSLTPSCPALDPPPADLIKSLNTCPGNEYFIPTKFHKHASSGSVVKADYACSHIYRYISAPLPLLHLNIYIKISLKFFKHFNLYISILPIINMERHIINEDKALYCIEIALKYTKMIKIKRKR